MKIWNPHDVQRLMRCVRNTSRIPALMQRHLDAIPLDIDDTPEELKEARGIARIRYEKIKTGAEALLADIAELRESWDMN